MDPAATIVITTKDRRDELRNALQSCLTQDVPLEILVIDDGSSDGTSDMVRAEFPSVRLVRVEKSVGLIVNRTRAAALVSTPFIISIDDDAIFPSPRTVRQTLADFDHPRIGAVAIPYIDVKKSPEVRQKAPDDRERYVIGEFRGTAHALRTDLFRALGAYRGYLFHQGEEGDYCARLINSGHVTRVGRADPIHHLESPRRDWTRIIFYQCRNNVLYTWYNVPMPYFPAHLVVTIFKSIWNGIRFGYGWAAIRGCFNGLLGIVHEIGRRRPIQRRTYLLIRLLRRRGVLTLAEIEPMLQLLERNWQAKQGGRASKPLS